MLGSPCDQPTERRPALCGDLEPSEHARTNLHRPVALVVTREQVEMAFLQRALDQLGIDAVSATNDDVALTLFMERQSQIALVLMATGQMGLNSTQVLAELRAVNPAVRCILIGTPRKPSPRGERYLRRPLNLDNLKTAVRESVRPGTTDKPVNA